MLVSVSRARQQLIETSNGDNTWRDRVAFGLAPLANVPALHGGRLPRCPGVTNSKHINRQWHFHRHSLHHRMHRAAHLQQQVTLTRAGIGTIVWLGSEPRARANAGANRAAPLSRRRPIIIAGYGSDAEQTHQSERGDEQAGTVSFVTTAKILWREVLAFWREKTSKRLVIQRLFPWMQGVSSEVGLVCMGVRREILTAAAAWQALLALVGLVVVLAAVWWAFEPAQRENAAQVRSTDMGVWSSALLCCVTHFFVSVLWGRNDPVRLRKTRLPWKGRARSAWTCRSTWCKPTVGTSFAAVRGWGDKNTGRKTCAIGPSTDQRTADKGTECIMEYRTRSRTRRLACPMCRQQISTFFPIGDQQRERLR